MNRVRRKQFLVNPFQNRLLLIYLVHFVIVSVISLGAFLITVNARLSSTTLSGTQQEEVAGLLEKLGWQLWPAYVVVFVMLVAHSILVTHRVAGPITKLKDALRRIGEGDLSQEVHFRRTDYLREEAEALNDMVEALRGRFAAVRDEQHALEGAIHSMAKAIEGGSIGEMRHAQAVMEGRIGCLRRELDKFMLRTAEGETTRRAHEPDTIRQPEPVA